MEVYDAIYKRRTVRNFQDKKIDFDTIKKLLKAGLQAPTNNHMRQWEFVVIQDKEKRKKIIEKIKKNVSKEDSINIVDNWGLIDNDQKEMYIDAIPKQYTMLLNAACLIIPFFRQSNSLLKPTSLSNLNSFASIWCCIENIFIAAASEDIYGVTRIPFDEEIKHIKSILNVPVGYEFPCYIAIGYPLNDTINFKQKKHTIDEKIHLNNW
ncbi:MAG: nitroreductase family protein [Clostridiales bacterium]